ncbi:MAG: hypothetical protein H0X02_08200 [Nitrosomonas sp.]|nr:hypothetical protein [Nitrosomonas sp.]
MKILKVKGRVTSERFAGGNAVSVYVEDLSPALAEQVRSACRQYQYGTYNGNEDMYEGNNIRDELPQVKYVQVSNRPSAVIKERIAQALLDTKYPGFESAQSGMGSEIIYQSFHNKEFWKEHLAA